MNPDPQGWICPKCGTVWSPQVRSCAMCAVGRAEGPEAGRHAACVQQVDQDERDVQRYGTDGSSCTVTWGPDPPGWGWVVGVRQ